MGDDFEDLTEFTEKQIKLLKIEQDADKAESLELLNTLSSSQAAARGTSVFNLIIAELEIGLYGRYKTQFQLKSGKFLLSHKLTVGDIVGVRKCSSKIVKHLDTGVVVKVKEDYITVAFEKDISDVIDSESTENSQVEVDETFRLDRLSDEVTHKRLNQTMMSLRNYKPDYVSSAIIDVLFQSTSGGIKKLSPPLEIKPWTPLSENLNPSQISAIDASMKAREIAVIHGPPGTGKTTTVVELIRQLVASGLRVLACAPSNIAVDNMLERLASSTKLSRKDVKKKHKKKKHTPSTSIRMVRIGHPARLLPSVVDHCLDSRICSADGSSIVKEVRKEVSDLLEAARKVRNKMERVQIRGEIKELRKEIRVREKNVIKDILMNSDVVFSTCSGASSEKVLPGVEGFDVVIIDEAAQALEASCWISILKGKKVILSGDPCQLPPTIRSGRAASEGLGTTLVDRVNRLYPTAVHLLDIQYRMNGLISDWCSGAMYQHQLKSDPTVVNRTVKDLVVSSAVAARDSNSEDSLQHLSPLVLIDTAGYDVEEQQDALSLSRSNTGESELVLLHCKYLIETVGVRSTDIAVISPYNRQVYHLKQLVGKEFPEIEIKSVDGFQGREKEIVILSLVRSNVRRQIGFLQDDRRLNVAITRARVQVCVICDSDTISSHPFLRAMVGYFNKYGHVTSPMEYCSNLSNTPRVTDDYVYDEIVSKFSHSVYVCNDNKIKTREAGSKKLKSVSNSIKRKGITEGEKREMKEYYSYQLNLFKDDEMYVIPGTDSYGDGWYGFPASMSGYQRMLIHDSAEKIGGILHSSSGNNEDRYIKIKRNYIIAQKKNSANGENSTPGVSLDGVDCSSVVGLKPAGGVVDTGNATPATSNNLLMKSLTLERAQRIHGNKCNTADSSAATDIIEMNAPQSSNKKTRRKKKSKKSKKQFQSSVSVGALYTSIEDEMELLDAVLSRQGQCFFKNCMVKNVAMVGSVCSFCKQRYCLTHAQAEIHGCADAVRAKVRSRWMSDKSEITKKNPTIISSANSSTFQKRLMKSELQKKLSKKSEERGGERRTEMKNSTGNKRTKKKKTKKKK